MNYFLQRTKLRNGKEKKRCKNNINKYYDYY